MIDITMAGCGQALPARTDAIFQDHRRRIYRETDRMFAWLMIFQWFAGMAIALWLSPRTWDGMQSRVHPHLREAIWFGAVLSVFPAFLAWWQPGAALTRHVIAVGQLLTSSLLIHITGGRIETHFHVFGSLAFLAFYRDWRVLITASLVSGADHAIGALFWPSSLYGVSSTTVWRAVEHAGWVAFCDLFLIRSCLRSRAEMREIAGRQARNSDLLYQAQHDSLTGLPNRILFSGALTEALSDASENSSQVALLAIDLDGFKQVNDNYGHQTGDRLLIFAAERLAAALSPDGVLARTGGDEFTVLLRNAASSKAVRRDAQDLLDALARGFTLGDAEFRVSASIGICMYPDGAADAVQLYSRADYAMYNVKRRGKNGFDVYSGSPLAAAL